MMTLRLFPTVGAAMAYRFEHGTGGWIFAPEDSPATPHHCDMAQVVLFSPEFTPTAIFQHALTRGKSGRLISA